MLTAFDFHMQKYNTEKWFVKKSMTAGQCRFVPGKKEKRNKERLFFGN